MTATLPHPAVTPAADGAADAAWRTSGLGALLFGSADRCVRIKLTAVHAGGFPAISAAQLTLFHHLRPGGMRLTELALAANLTKQSMIELVDRAEALGLVERRPDPDDGRAKAVDVTARGTALLNGLREGVITAERAVAEVFGASFLLEVRQRLDAYAPQAEHRPTRAYTDEDGWRLHNIARMFALSGRRFLHEALDISRERGWQSVPEVLMPLFRHLDLSGSRLSDVAAAARMTKQSMRELVDRGESLGLVLRLPDPADRRAKTIAFTPAGLAMLDDLRRSVALAEAGFRQQAGRDFTARLKDRLRAFVLTAGDRRARPITSPRPAALPGEAPRLGHFV